MNAQFSSEISDSGEFQRQEDAFRKWISSDGSTSYPDAAGRYHRSDQEILAREAPPATVIRALESTLDEGRIPVQFSGAAS